MANKGSFRPGDPRAGRPPGRQNNVKREVRLLARELVSNPEYMAALRRRNRRAFTIPANWKKRSGFMPMVSRRNMRPRLWMMSSATCCSTAGNACATITV